MKLFNFIILFIFFFIFSSNNLEAENNINPCLNNKAINITAIEEDELPNKISVKINNNRKFVKNNLAILKSNTTIKKKFKKRYSGKVKVFYKNKKKL